tara:strand:- start:3657 stop:4136 length:480 start_codon:yes stop_codon:yes gene_type:complete
MKVAGVKEVQKALEALTFRQRQNIERKAARASMGALKRALQREWKSVSVEDATSPIKHSIRKGAAKAETVKVGTRRRGTDGGVYGRVFLNYKKKNAKPAKMAHFLERGHKAGTRFVAAKAPTARHFARSSGKYRDIYMKAVMLWITSPKLTQKQARGLL